MSAVYDAYKHGRETMGSTLTKSTNVHVTHIHNNNNTDTAVYQEQQWQKTSPNYLPFPGTLSSRAETTIAPDKNRSTCKKCSKMMVDNTQFHCKQTQYSDSYFV